MKSTFALVALLLSFNTFAAPQVCTYDYVQDGSSIKWTAFKTPKKAPVKGQLTSFSIKTKKASPTIDSLLDKATFSIDTSAIDTGDKVRDGKIFEFFFKKMMKGTKITGKVLKASSTQVEMELMMNGSKKVVMMTPVFDEVASTLTLSGAIDVLEFNMEKNLASLTEACKALHEGVTWPNVEISLAANVKKSCK